MKQRIYWVLAAILVVTGLAIWLALPDHPGIHIGSGEDAFDRDVRIHQGLDLQGGIQVLLEADLPEDAEIDAQAMSTARRIIEDRVNGLGVTEPLVQLQGSRRIIVELPGLEQEEQAISTIRQTGLMEFIDTGDQPLEPGTLVQTDFVPGMPITESPVAPQMTPEGEPIYHTVMTGEALKTAWLASDNSKGYLEYAVGFELNPDWATVFSDYTGSHLNQFLTIVLDKRVISSPRIESRIPDGQGTISGQFEREDAESLAIQLQYGALPIPLRIESNQKIGPSLGQESIDQSIKAGIVGLSAVLLFMLILYRLPGLLADLSLIVYGLLNLAVFKLGSTFMIVVAVVLFIIYLIERRDNWLLWMSIGLAFAALVLDFQAITLTLPGIAGFLLSTGMAVDANILIFERMKEELRAGKTLQAAVAAGFDRAWTSIWDSQASTLIICAILYVFGSNFGASIVKGFAITLAIGTVLNLFTAITVTRTFMAVAVQLGQKGLERKKWLLGA
jgi:protein-export membrane protein SecD